MSSHYTTEPPPTASVLLQTTAGPLTISLFAIQTPLTCRNFLQHVLDGYYENNIFHRISPGFVIQTGDATGTGEGGENIYEDPDFERYDEHWARIQGREKGEKIVFGDEVHSRLKFNRRGLVGLAKGSGEGGGYGSQFFITLGDCRAELDGRCTMFGRIEGDGIYNVVKIAEGELVEGSERPVYPEKILKAEILEMPKGEAWHAMKPRQRTSARVVEEPMKKKAPKKKAAKALLSFGGDDGDDQGPGVAVRPKKAKFNPALIEGDAGDEKPRMNGSSSKKRTSPPPSKRKDRPLSPISEPQSQIPQKRKADSPSRTPSPIHRRKPSMHDPTTQLPLRDPESPSRSPTPDTPPTHTSKQASTNLAAEIAALKASMRRDTGPSNNINHKKKSALESLIPATSTRGRKRPRPGDTSANAKEDANALRMLNAFKARLDSAAPATSSSSFPNAAKAEDKGKGKLKQNGAPAEPTRQKLDPATAATTSAAAADDEDEEATLCDLHFIANCQSCQSWDKDLLTATTANTNNDSLDNDVEEDEKWMSHVLSFEKDRLGKDLTWKRKNEEELVVIDPRERERELLGTGGGKGKGKGKGNRDKR